MIGVRVQCAACGKTEEMTGASPKLVEHLMEHCRQKGWMSTPEGWCSVWHRPSVVACSSDCAAASIAKVREEAIRELNAAFDLLQLEPIR